MISIPNDKGAITFIYKQHQLHAEMQTDKLMHIAGSFGKPGSLTEGGQRYRAHSFELGELNYAGLLYALVKGYIRLDQVIMKPSYFGAPPPDPSYIDA